VSICNDGERHRTVPGQLIVIIWLKFSVVEEDKNSKGTFFTNNDRTVIVMHYDTCTQIRMVRAKLKTCYKNAYSPH
jgi:hypothetical protein